MWYVQFQATRNFFTEIISSISDLKFSRDGRQLLTRDYMTLKLWDVRKESGPVAVHNVHEGLRSRVRHCSLTQCLCQCRLEEHLTCAPCVCARMLQHCACVSDVSASLQAGTAGFAQCMPAHPHLLRGSSCPN